MVDKKDERFQTPNEVLLTIVLDSYEYDLELSAQRLEIFKSQDDMETFALELPFYTKTMFKVKQIKQLIQEELGASISLSHTVSLQTEGWEPEVYTSASVADLSYMTGLKSDMPPSHLTKQVTNGEK